MLISAEIRYILHSLFLSVKESTSKTRKKNLIHFKSTFRSRENQILEF